MRNIRSYFISLIVFIFVIVPVIIAVLANSQGNSKSSTIATPTPSITFKQTTNNSAKTEEQKQINTVTEDTTQTWIIGNHPFYTISFLSAWKSEYATNKEGGTIITFKPKKLNQYQIIPSLVIEEWPENNEVLARKLSLIASKGLTRQPEMFHGISATSYSGTILNTPQPADPAEKYIYTKHIVLTKTYRTYSISYSYYANQQDESYKEIFTIMLDSLGFSL